MRQSPARFQAICPEGPKDTCLTQYPKCDDLPKRDPNNNGVIAIRTETLPVNIKDGLSQTLLVGEKYINPVEYLTGKDLGDTSCAYRGYSVDTNRWVPDPNTTGVTSDYKPRRDTIGALPSGQKSENIFGSAHSAGFHVVFCDGSAYLVPFAVDLKVFGSLGVRNDGNGYDASRIEP